ncbi:YfhO family protein [Candidatus Daviesbacteria bacterium]|nr:YfhO family protein [Candidatus Daviesbacteria bacterium]
MKLLLDENFPIKTTSVTNDFEFNSSSTESLNANLEYKPITHSHLAVKTAANIDSYLVVLDSFYPGWKAFIDGRQSKIYRTNYNFRGVFLPKGNHTIDFIYSPNSLKYGAIISGITLVGIIILLIYPLMKRS